MFDFFAPLSLSVCIHRTLARYAAISQQFGVRHVWGERGVHSDQRREDHPFSDCRFTPVLRLLGSVCDVLPSVVYVSMCVSLSACAQLVPIVEPEILMDGNHS